MKSTNARKLDRKSGVRFRERGAPVFTSSTVEPEVTYPDLDYAMDKKVRIRGIPHLAKNERDMGHPPIRGRDTSYDFWFVVGIRS
jgi:hypothetical protein